MSIGLHCASFRARETGEITFIVSHQVLALNLQGDVPSRGSKSDVVPIAGLTFGIATPGPHYKCWITTQALDYRGELVAWCEEIDMSGVQEEIIEVGLPRNA